MKKLAILAVLVAAGVAVYYYTDVFKQEPAAGTAQSGAGAQGRGGQGRQGGGQGGFGGGRPWRRPQRADDGGNRHERTARRSRRRSRWSAI